MLCIYVIADVGRDETEFCLPLFSGGTLLQPPSLGPWFAAVAGACTGFTHARCRCPAWLSSRGGEVWEDGSGRETVPLCRGGHVSAQPPRARLALALTRNGQGLPRLLVSCRQRKAAKEYGNSEQSKGYYKENGNFNKGCKRRKASRCAGSAVRAYICREKNFLVLKEVWNTTQGRRLPNQFFILSSLLMLQRKLSNKN